MKFVGKCSFAGWVAAFSIASGWGCGTPPDLWDVLRPGQRPQRDRGGDGHPAPPAPIDPRISRACLEERLTPYIEAIGAGWPEAFRPTGTVLVAASNQPLYSEGFGAADFDQGSPNTPRTSFRVGSITKGFTAVAVLQLAEAGQLALDDTLGELLPGYPEVGAGITVHQLLSHTSGLPNYTENAELMARRDQPITPEELLATFWNEPLQFTPGTEYRYSNSGYVVLGAIIERVSGQAYADYMQQAIFDPAGLKRTTVGDAEGLEDRALGYSADLHGRLVPASAIDMSVPYAAGAVRSTALDLVRWHGVLSTDLLLGESSRALLTTPVLASYAYGWVSEERNGLEVLWHNGGIDGFSSALMRVPELDLAVVVLLNSEAVDVTPMADAALRCALGESIEPEPPPALVELDAEARERLAGSYLMTEEDQLLVVSAGLPEEQLPDFATIDVFEEEEDMFLELIAGTPDLLLPVSETEFLIPSFDATVRFPLEDAEAPLATELELELGGLVLHYER